MFREYDPKQILSPECLTQYFQYYFFDRARAMSYTISNGSDENMVDLLSTNSKNIGWEVPCLNPNKKIRLMKQSFMDAANLFKVIDAPTYAVVVPYQGGKSVVDALCALEQRFVATQYFARIREAQRYSVNVFPNVWQHLINANAVHETQEGSGIFYLDSQYYSEQFGLSTNPVKSMESLII